MRIIRSAVGAAFLVLAINDVSAWQYCYQDYRVCCQRPIVCSPVFFMPLQYAPSPIDGGYYYILPDGHIQGPNYYLRPPFNPVEGFNRVPKEQEIFLMVLKDTLEPKKGKGQQQQGRGIGNYNSDYTNPQTLPYYQNQGGPPGHHAGPPPQGFGPPPGMPPPGYGPPPGYPPGFPGGPPPDKTMIAQGQGPMLHTVGYHRANYHQANYNFNLPALPNPGYTPQTPPAMPAYGYGMTPVWQPAYGYYPNYAMAPAPMPTPGYNAGHTLPYIPMPTPGYNGYAPPAMPTPAYTPPIPNASYTPNLPQPGYTPNLSNLNPGYEPPQGPPTQERFLSPSANRSPRDFFMFNENIEDQKAKQSRPAMIP